MLSRRAIRHLIEAGLIKVEPEPKKIGPNSIDIHLGDTLQMYAPAEYEPPRMKPNVLNNRVRVRDPVSGATHYAIDPKNPPPLRDVPKLDDGRWLLVPGQFYIGVTRERTYTRGVVPHLDGRSTCGRLSIEAHKTAGVGDNGFNGRWTLEIEATEPVLVAPGDRLFQIYFTPCWGAGLAVLIEATLKGEKIPWAEDLLLSRGEKDENGVTMRHYEALLELHDLYGGEGHHYQGSDGARGAAPLDED